MVVVIGSQVERRAFVTPDGEPKTEVTDKPKALSISLPPSVDATEKALATWSVAPQPRRGRPSRWPQRTKCRCRTSMSCS